MKICKISLYEIPPNEILSHIHLIRKPYCLENIHPDFSLAWNGVSRKISAFWAHKNIAPSLKTFIREKSAKKDTSRKSSSMKSFHMKTTSLENYLPFGHIIIEPGNHPMWKNLSYGVF